MPLSASAEMIPGINRYRPSARWYGSVLVPIATCSRRHFGGRNLLAQHAPDVDLDHDLGVEVVTGVEIQVGVGVPGEAVDAAVGAAAVRVDRPAERHRRIPGHLVQRRSAVHLVEGHAGELRGPDGADADPPAGPCPEAPTGPRPTANDPPTSSPYPNICSDGLASEGRARCSRMGCDQPAEPSAPTRAGANCCADTSLAAAISSSVAAFDSRAITAHSCSDSSENC